ncbi:MFS transporter permease [Candidatus Sulfopaludibacter sp. SbA6]|nr:MFS transporter permease [Candidatus Sulfopaludibacter sp. SbA6]
MMNLQQGSGLLPQAPADSAKPPPASQVRYRVLGLSFLMAFMMYMERGAIGAAAPTIMREFHVDKISMGWAISAFNWSYALFQVPGGWMADRFGPRIVLATAMAWWSVFTAATGLTFNVSSLATTRFLFGVGEAAAFPAGSRALARWLPVRRRAFGQGFQHSGSRLGAALAPALVVTLIAWSGWRPIFYIFGAGGIVWAAVWGTYYRDFPCEHPGINAGELAILGTTAARVPSGARPRVPWGLILRSRDLWYLSTIYFCYGWVLWLYLAWFPSYLREARHFTQLGMGLASLPLLAATVTNVVGGLLSDRLAHQWNDLRRGRLMVSICGFAIAGIALLPGVLAAGAVAAMVCLTIALAGLELTVSVSWAICIDIGGDFSGSVSSVMNTWGNVGGAVSAVMVGYLATLFGWTSPFLLASALCLFSALLVSRIDPRRPATGHSGKEYDTSRSIPV